MHKTCFFVNLNSLAQDDDNMFGTVILKKWNDQHACRPITCKEMVGTF